MQLGMVGLGRMGANMARRLLRAGHRVVAYDRDPAPAHALEREGAAVAASLDDLVRRLEPPRAAWIMVPAGAPTEEAVHALGERLVRGGVVGLERGYSLMIGGDAEAVRLLEPVFRSLAPGRGAAAITPGRADRSST